MHVGIGKGLLLGEILLEHGLDDLRDQVRGREVTQEAYQPQGLHQLRHAGDGT